MPPNAPRAPPAQLRVPDARGGAGPRPREDDSPAAAAGANTVGRRSFPASKATLAPQEESASRAVVTKQSDVRAYHGFRDCSGGQEIVEYFR
ncbi:hypothetical protein NDU88_005693 [Pleurodeles waltl]|uniref:Uncharacterized protein n=1 Tax=Pleurodeles waltl TaxID=8319 RepID=A0AAV7UJG1_PLEWA|nr:hypothetical protein NDU88_005693 [Pleurodeles waltl]